MTCFRLKFVHEFRDCHGKGHRYLRRLGCKSVPLPGLPGSAERIFKAAKKAGVEAHQARRAETVRGLGQAGGLSDAAQSERA
jgi:hypothetical protein